MEITRIAGVLIVLFTAHTVGVSNVTLCYSTTTTRYCFYTDGRTDKNWTQAREFCLSMNATLPIITDDNVQNFLEQFRSDNSVYSILSGNAVWIGAHTVPVNASVPWHWINGMIKIEPPQQDVDGLGLKWCSSISRDNSGNIQLHQQHWTENRSFMCQYTDVSCGGFVLNSSCYKVYTEQVRWFTAVNRCRSYNGTLAVFDDNQLANFNRSWISQSPLAWVGLIKSWWIWSDLDSSRDFNDVLYNKFFDWPGNNPYPSPPGVPNSTVLCAVAAPDGWWPLQCSQPTRFVCQTAEPLQKSSPRPSSSSTTNAATLPSSAVISTTTTNHTSLQSTSKGDKTSIIVGVVVGVVGPVVVIIIIILVVVLSRRGTFKLLTNKQKTSNKHVTADNRDSTEQIVPVATEYEVIPDHRRTDNHVTKDPDADQYATIVSRSPANYSRILDERNDAGCVHYADLDTVTETSDRNL